jgi:hypothetical protein
MTMGAIASPWRYDNASKVRRRSEFSANTASARRKQLADVRLAGGKHTVVADMRLSGSATGSG